jgi:hypothetical protein
MVSLLASNAADRGFEADRLIPKTIKLLFVASLVSTRSIKEKDQTLIGSESG